MYNSVAGRWDGIRCKEVAASPRGQGGSGLFAVLSRLPEPYQSEEKRVDKSTRLFFTFGERNRNRKGGASRRFSMK